MSSKRSLEEYNPDSKKFRNEKELQDYSTSEEWPVYCHPEGGIVKITPWGSLRQYPHPVTGETVTKFEDMSFQEHSFNQNQPDYMPTTPQLMCPPSSPTPGRNLKLSPSDEVESYVMDGYTVPQQQFSQEQENYFGMAEENEMLDS